MTLTFCNNYVLIICQSNQMGWLKAPKCRFEFQIMPKSGFFSPISTNVIIYFNENYNFSHTSLLGRSALIFYLNCEHVLFLHFITRKKKIADFQELKFFFTILKTFKTHFFIIRIPSLWSRDVPIRFDVYKQTNRQTNQIYI